MLRLLLPKSPSSQPIIKLFTSSSSSSSTTTSSIDPSCSLTLHFLKKSCHLPPATALSASKKVHLKTTKNAHQVLSLLKSYHFTGPDISRVVAVRPRILFTDPIKFLKPKFDFFESIGFAGSAVTKLMTSVPALLQSSLPNKLQHNFNVLESLLHSQANAVSAVLCYPALLVSDLENVLLREKKILEDYGVPKDVILMLMTMHCKSFRPGWFEETFEIMKKLGISPKRNIFAHAFGVLAKLPDKEWAKRVEFFNALGWTEEQVLVAFARHPYIMRLPIEKIVKSVEFYREKFGWDSSYVSKNSVVLSFSYEKRILLRWRVFSVLEEKGLFSGRVGAKQMLIGEREFLEKYVIRFCEEVPEVIDDDVRVKLEGLGLLVGEKRKIVASEAVDS